MTGGMLLAGGCGHTDGKPQIDKTNHLKEAYELKGHPFGGTCTAAEYIKREGFDAFGKFKEKLVQEFNSLGIKDLKVNDLNLLNGFYVNLEYHLPNGHSVKLLEDNKVYMGNQIQISGTSRCYGIVADEEYLLVCEYGCDGTDPQIVVYKRREKLS